MLLTGMGEILYFLPVILVFNNWMGNYAPIVMRKKKESSLTIFFSICPRFRS